MIEGVDIRRQLAAALPRLGMDFRQADAAAAARAGLIADGRVLSAEDEAEIVRVAEKWFSERCLAFAGDDAELDDLTAKL